MTRTGYFVLKTHFDKFLRGGYPGNGLEHIRDVYEYAFGRKIHSYDIYQTPIRIAGNCINKIITLVGPDDPDLECGIIPCLDDITCVSIFNKDYFIRIDSNNINNYVTDVYSAMNNVVLADNLSKELPNSILRNNPYCAFLKLCPFYFTFHHINECIPDMIDCETFPYILEKYICDGEDVGKIMDSIKSRKYNPDFEDIYSTMTCDNTIGLFY